MSNAEANRLLSNYIRIHRRRAALTQHELGLAVGYDNGRQIARHEKSLATPSLELALGYEIVFRVPVAEIFSGLRDDIAGVVEPRLAEFERRLGQSSVRDKDAAAIARKLMWLNERKSADYEPLA